ncbi:hypothetical protein OPT61_g3934 [Boeremia exigua]|uniref:Uncharacterized protein n=1 Tax=Boeremia exigua TaxID=749465 RepID=A0ACC2IG33_9PLEO|nr:hypothetical protein OPT61_g3934 [Boeremia exigua]
MARPVDNASTSLHNAGSVSTGKVALPVTSPKRKSRRNTMAGEEEKKNPITGNAPGGRGGPASALGGDPVGGALSSLGGGNDSTGDKDTNAGFGLDGKDVKGSLKVHIKLDLEADIRIIARIKGDIAIGLLLGRWDAWSLTFSFWLRMDHPFALFTSAAVAVSPSKVGDAVVFGRGGTYPRATKLANGSIVGAYTSIQGDNTTILTVRSTDNGVSWQLLGSVDTGPKATKDVDNPYVHELPDGKLLCTFRNHDRASPSTYSFYRITICVSEDGGATWKYLSTPASDPAGPTGNWEPFLQQALDGTLQLYYSRENNPTDQDSLLRRSGDGGKTWTSAQIISGTGLNTRDGMLGVARTSVGSRSKVAVFETGNPGLGTPFGVWSVRSEDDGASWSSKRTVVYQPSGHNAGAPQIIRVGDKLVASFGTDEDGGIWPGGAIKLMVSSDQGASWADKTIVHEASAYWAGLLALDEKQFLVLYEFKGTSFAQRMTF